MPRKSHREKEKKDWEEDENEVEEDVAEEEDEDSEEDDDDDTIDLEEAEAEEEDEDDSEDEDDELIGESVEDIEKRRLFQNEGEEALEHLTLEDMREVLTENDMDTALAPRLKKLLAEVISEGESTSMDEAWEEALARLEEEEE